MFTATGIRLSELAGIRYHPGDPARSDLDLQAREIRIRGKGGTARAVKIGHQAARSLDRYLRARTRHAQAHRPQLWLGVNNRGPLTAARIYQIVARRGRQCSVNAYPHPFRHHFSHTWLDRGGAERDLMERLDLPADAHPVRRQRPRHPRPPQLRPHHGRHLTPAIVRSRSTPQAQRSARPRGTARATRPGQARHGRGRPHTRRHPAPHLHGTRRNRAGDGSPSRTRRCPMPGADPQAETMAITQGQLPHNAESRL